MEDPHAVFAFVTTVPISGEAAVTTHTHGFHELIFLLDGEAVQWLSGRAYPLRPGDLYFLPAGDWHIATTMTSGRVIVLNFYESAFSRSTPADRETLALVRLMVERARSGKPEVALPQMARKRLCETLTQAARECEIRESGWQTAAKVQLQSLLLLVRREAAFGREADAQDLGDLSVAHAAQMEKALAHIREHLADSLSVADVSRVAGMGHSLFCRQFREFTGHTLVRYVNRLRVEQACRLLAGSDCPLPIVAERCGFPCASHFFAVFRGLTGHTPRDFRVRHRVRTSDRAMR